MSKAERVRTLESAQDEEDDAQATRWSYWLVIFLRTMAGLSLIKGLYHWAVICGVGAPPHAGFESYPAPYQAATAFFAVIDLVAAVGLWLAAPWGAVIWLTSVISMAAIQMLFPQIYGGNFFVVLFELMLLGAYVWLTIMAAREQPT